MLQYICWTHWIITVFLFKSSDGTFDGRYDCNWNYVFNVDVLIFYTWKKFDVSICINVCCVCFIRGKNIVVSLKRNVKICPNCISYCSTYYAAKSIYWSAGIDHHNLRPTISNNLIQFDYQSFENQHWKIGMTFRNVIFYVVLTR